VRPRRPGRLAGIVPNQYKYARTAPPTLLAVILSPQRLSFSAPITSIEFGAALEQSFFYYLAGVPLLGIAAQWLAWRLRLPSILLLLAFGVLLGLLFKSPDELLAELVGQPGDASVGPRLLLPVVSLSVAVILFEGGLTLQFHELKTAGSGVLRLVTIGALVSWVLATMAGDAFLPGFGTRLAALLGAVLIVTGPTVVAPLLRHIQPVPRVASVVKWEGIIIDPIGAVLAVLVFEEILLHGANASPAAAALLLLKTVVLGGGLGWLTAKGLIEIVRRYWIPDYLHGVVFLAVALASFAVSNYVQEESGLVTVTVLGVILANQRAISIRHVIELKEHLGVFLISCLFIVLGSRLDPAAFLALGWQGLAFLAVLILIVRPVSVFVATWGAQLNWREKLFLACLAPRGIVAAAVISVFALKVETLAHERPDMQFLTGQADQLVPLTFLVIVGTVGVYGLSAGPIARSLGLSDVNPQGLLIAGADPWMRKIAAILQEEGLQVVLVDTNYKNVAMARMDGLRAECASVLSEYIREEFNLSGIGRLLAMTPNDEVNALAVREFVHRWGRANVYQLPPQDDRLGPRSSVAEHLRGRQLFAKELNYLEIAHRFEAGAHIKKTRLSDEFTWDDFVERYGESSVLLFVITESKKLRVTTSREPIKPLPGQSVIALVDVEDEKGTG